MNGVVPEKWDNTKCACVNHDPYECARIRDGRHARDEYDYHKRECECCCHDNYDDDDDWDDIYRV